MDDQIKKIGDDMKKEAEEWVKYVDEQSDKVVKFVRKATNDLSKAFERETKKMELRSEIGEHQRSLTKAYTKLGEAYYDAENNHTAMGDVSETMTLITSNRRLIDMLKSQLDDLEKKK